MKQLPDCDHSEGPRMSIRVPSPGKCTELLFKEMSGGACHCLPSVAAHVFSTLLHTLAERPMRQVMCT